MMPTRGGVFTRLWVVKPRYPPVVEVFNIPYLEESKLVSTFCGTKRFSTGTLIVSQAPLSASPTAAHLRNAIRVAKRAGVGGMGWQREWRPLTQVCRVLLQILFNSQSEKQNDRNEERRMDRCAARRSPPSRQATREFGGDAAPAVGARR